MQCSRFDICPSCFLYDLSNTIFCPIGSALTKHLVASQIWTHNSNTIIKFNEFISRIMQHKKDQSFLKTRVAWILTLHIILKRRVQDLWIDTNTSKEKWLIHEIHESLIFSSLHIQSLEGNKYCLPVINITVFIWSILFYSPWQSIIICTCMQENIDIAYEISLE